MLQSKFPKIHIALGLIGGLAIALLASCTIAVQTPESFSDGLRDRPLQPRSIHAYGKDYDLASVKNPLGSKILAQLETDPGQAYKIYLDAVKKGSDVYNSHCVHCHGDLLDGDGMIAKGQNPPPTDFRNDTTFSEVRDSYLFWRIVTGGPGLPKEFEPWKSSMPVGERLLSEEEAWNVIVLLRDRVGQFSQGWNAGLADVAQSMRDISTGAEKDAEAMRLYLSRCAVCHGDEGEGDGPAARFIYPAPRDFTVGLFKYKNSKPKNLRPRDENLFDTIKHGLPRTAMPAWKSELSDEQIRSLILVIKGFDWIGTWAPEGAPDDDFDEDGLYKGKPISVADELLLENRIPATPASLARGKQAFLKNCSPCHGDEGRGSPSAEKKLRDEWGARIWPRDLTKPWTWRVTNVDDNAEQTIANIFTRLSVGIPGTPMPEHASGVSQTTRWDIANYVYSLRVTTPSLSESLVIEATKVEGRLPKSINDGIWATAKPTTFMMIPNVLGGDRLIKPLNDSISVRALSNHEEVAIMLEFDDRTHSRPGDPDAEKIRDPKLPLYPDAVAIQFPKQGAFSSEPVIELPLFEHGDRSHGTTIWYWRAESVEPSVPPATIIFDAGGFGEKLKPRSADNSVTAEGEWVNGRWRVMFKRRIHADDVRDVSFADGAFIPISFAEWDGSNGETGSKHMLSSWYWLSLPSP